MVIDSTIVNLCSLVFCCRILKYSFIFENVTFVKKNCYYPLKRYELKRRLLYTVYRFFVNVNWFKILTGEYLLYKITLVFSKLHTYAICFILDNECIFL